MSAKPSSFRCAACGRRFARRGQAHSCQVTDVNAHFRGKPAELRRLFDHLCRTLRRFGPLRVDAVKTSINLIPKHHLGSVRVLRDRLRLAFVLSRRAAGAEIERTEQISPTAFLHVVHLAKRADVSPALLRLFKEAFDRAARASE